MSLPATLSSLETLNGNYEHEPAWWPNVCARISEGTGYWVIAQELGIKAQLFRGWIGGDAEREKAFLAALKYRDEYRQEVARQKLHDIVDTTLAAGDINPAHVLKAIEATLPKGGGTSVSVNAGSGNHPMTVVFVEANNGRPA